MKKITADILALSDLNQTDNRIKARWLEPRDFEKFAQWVSSNTDIPRDDTRILKYPRTLTMVFESDGAPILFVPITPVYEVGFLGFKPDLDARTKAKALRRVIETLNEVMLETQIPETEVFTRAEYPIGKWATKHGFVERDKPGFRMIATPEEK